MAASKNASYMPTHSYQKTMALFTITGEGHISSVADCPSGAFRALVLTAATTARNSETVSKQLALLDYIHLADRWYAIEELTQCGAAIPLFATERAAEQHKGKELLKQ